MNRTRLFSGVVSALGALLGGLVLMGAPAQAYEARSTPNNTMLVKLDAGNSHMTKRITCRSTKP